MKIVFMGTPDFSVTCLEAVAKAGHEILMVVTQPDKPKGRGGAMAMSPVKEWAIEHNLPVFQPAKIKTAESVEELRKLNADLFLVVAFGQILSKEILDMPPLGCVNVHASLLPKYRGAAPIQWAVINGDEVSGVTTMQMGVGVDDGDMLLKREVPLAADETGGSLFDKLAVTGGELAVETLEKLEKGEITPVPQDESKVTHVGMIKKDFGRVDFTKSAEEIERLIRGLNPWPSAFTFLEGKTLKLWEATVVDKVDLSALPGSVVKADEKGLIICCGGNKDLCVTSLQIEGKKRMNTDDFLRGKKIEIGTKLG